MDKRAAAFANYNDAAVLQMLIEVLPQIAKEVAAPIASIDQLTVLSTDGAGALPKQVVENVAQTLQMLKTDHRPRPRGHDAQGGRPAAGRPPMRRVVEGRPRSTEA